MPSDPKNWTPDRYPIAFHEVLKAGEGRIEFEGTRWSPKTARVRWFWFVQAIGDKRIWTAKVEKNWLVLSSRARVTDLAGEAMERALKNLPDGG